MAGQEEWVQESARAHQLENDNLRKLRALMARVASEPANCLPHIRMNDSEIASTFLEERRSGEDEDDDPDAGEAGDGVFPSTRAQHKHLTGSLRSLSLSPPPSPPAVASPLLPKAADVSALRAPPPLHECEEGGEGDGGDEGGRGEKEEEEGGEEGGREEEAAKVCPQANRNGNNRNNAVRHNAINNNSDGGGGGGGKLVDLGVPVVAVEGPDGEVRKATEKRIREERNSMRLSNSFLAFPGHRFSLLGGNRLSHTAPARVSVFIATWNVGNVQPDEAQLTAWLPHCGCDIIAVGIQEFGQSQQAPSRKLSGLQAMRANSAPLFTRRSSSFADMLLKHYGKRYSKVASEGLGEMRLVVLCSSEIRPFVSNAKQLRKATGIGGVIGNKGGMMIKITVHNTDLCFLSCHLAAHESEEKVTRRNQDVHDILRAASNAGKEKLDITQRYHHTFVFGDLNYRINLAIRDGRGYEGKQHREEVIRLIKERDFCALYGADQLRREVRANNVLRGFKEAIPSFEPTFKVVRGAELDYNLSRVPSYCDRILWTSLPGLEKKIVQQGYMSASAVTSSDHKPVFSVFVVDIGESHTSMSSPRPERTVSESASRSRKRSLANLLFEVPVAPNKPVEQLVLNIHRLKGLNVSDEIYHATQAVLQVSGPVVVQDMVVPAKKPDEKEGNFLVDIVFDNVSLPLGGSRQEATHSHVILSLWDKEKTKTRKLLGQTVLSLAGLYNGTEKIIDQPLMRYGVACGELSGVLSMERTMLPARQRKRPIGAPNAFTPSGGFRLSDESNQ